MHTSHVETLLVALATVRAAGTLRQVATPDLWRWFDATHRIVEVGAYATIDDETRDLIDCKVIEAESLPAARTELFDKAAIALQSHAQAPLAPYRAWGYGFAVYLSKIATPELKRRGELVADQAVEAIELY